MSRFAPYLGIPFAIIIGSIAIVLANWYAPVPSVTKTSQKVASTTDVVALSTIPLPEGILVSAITTPEVAAIPSKVATKIPKTIPGVDEKNRAVPKAVVVPEANSPVVLPVATTTTVSVPVDGGLSGNVSLDVTARALRGAAVNIICYAPAGSKLHSISGSGIFIDSKGIILTNAHVAQYFLFKDRGVSCSIRTGSPAVDAYDAELVYISPSWIHANATVVTQTLPVGTGEYDFAFLVVTKSVTATPLPSVFPFVPLSNFSPVQGAPVVIATYGAQFLESNQIQSALFPTIVFGSIKNIFTFTANSVDVLDLGGSAAAQEGSSGGGVADSSGALVGTITTSTVEGTTSTRSLDAITASYIRAQYAREMGSSLDMLLNEPVMTSIADFASQTALLESIIATYL